jgi:nucleotide-binding universal stress UspA family protein
MEGAVKVLLSCDGSECSDGAVRFAATTLREQAKSLHVTILYVDAPMRDRVADALGEDAVARIRRENIDFAFRRARIRLKQAGVPFDESHHVGSVVEHICRSAGEGNFDLILMGSHGDNAFASLLLGSVTVRVLAESKVPVLVVR